MKVKKEKAKQEPIKIDYENKRLSTVYFMPLLLIAGFVPLIVYAKYIDLTGTTQSLYWTGQQQYLDFFSYWKSRWIMALTLIGLIFYIILYKQKKLPFKDLKQYYIPLGIYAIFVIISTIFAIDTQTALWGFVDMYQGVFILLSYVIITFLTINFVNSERDVNLFVKAFTFLMIVEGLIGITQYFGFDFFQTGIGTSLIVPGNIQVDGLSFSFGPKTIYGTLFNTNFVGSFAALMLPLSIAFFLSTKVIKHRIIFVITIVVTLFVFIGCNSRAGYFGMALAVITALILFRRNIIKNWKVFIVFVTCLFIFISGLNIASKGAVFNRISTINITKEMERLKAEDVKTTKFKDIILGQNTFSIVTDDETLNFKIDSDKIYFLDENNKELAITEKNNQIKIDDKRYENYIITIPSKYPGVTVSRDWHMINFYISDVGVKILGSGGRITEPIVAERLGIFDGYEELASNRGYIWGRTIPMIKSYLFKGAGSDNFPIVFPQDDYIAKLNANWDMDANLVIDKPHNLYLQVAVNTGLLSLIALILFWSFYIISSIRLYNKVVFNSLEKYIGASCLISVVGYLVAGIFNDQVVSVAPLFWLIIGLGISINVKLLRMEKQHQN